MGRLEPSGNSFLIIIQLKQIIETIKEFYNFKDICLSEWVRGCIFTENQTQICHHKNKEIK